MRHQVRHLVLIGLSVLAVGACGSPTAAEQGAPSFVQPSTGSSTSPAAQPAPASAPVSRPTAPAGARPVTYAFPVVGHTGYAHVHHDYPATDLMARCGTPVVATTAGTILAVVRKDTWNRKVDAGPTRGGLSVSLLGDDGVRYYGSHFSVIDPKITVGARVRTGQPLGKVGETGDASACHLHYGISPPCARQGDWWNQRGTIWPWPYLDSWRVGGSKSPVAEVRAWQAKHGCPTKPQTDP